MMRFANRYNAYTVRGLCALYLPPVLAVAVGLCVLLSPAKADVRIPALGFQLEQTLHDELENVWGLDANHYVALSAAQIHQESHWRPKAASKYAEGLTQFTPSTYKWIADKFPDELWPADPWDPYWSIRAMTIYDHWIHQRIDNTASACDAWAMTLSGYNGGLEWVKRDRNLCRLADHTDDNCHIGRWFGHVERFSGRAQWAFKENRGYPRRILLKLTPAYLNAGFDGQDLCEGIES